MAVTKTIKTSGGDYTSLAVAVAGVAALTTDVTLLCFGLDIGGAVITAGAWLSLTIIADASARHTGVVTGNVSAYARIAGTSSLQTHISSKTVVVDGIVFSNTSVVDVEDNATVQNCMFVGGSQYQAPMGSFSPTAINCVFYENSQMFIGEDLFGGTDTLSPTMYSCTFLGSSQVTYQSGGDSTCNAVIYNSVFMGLQPFGDGPNIFASATGCGGLSGWDSDPGIVFTEIGIQTLTIADVVSATDARPIIGGRLPLNGADISAGPAAAQKDIVGATRPNGLAFTIGVFEIGVLSPRNGFQRLISPHRVF